MDDAPAFFNLEGFQQLRQLGEVRRNPSRLIRAQQFGLCIKSIVHSRRANKRCPPTRLGGGFWWRAGQFLLREVEHRTVGQPFGVAFAAVSHRDDVPREDCTASGGVLFECPRGVAGLYSPPSIFESVL